MKMVKFFLGSIFVLYFSSVFSQVPQQKLPEKTRILFMLDGSGSMLAKWGNTLRIGAAKKMLADFVDSLAVNENLELALRVYGHQYDRRLQRCDDSKLEVGFGKKNHELIKTRLKIINPKGTTPIAYSLEQAAGDFPIDDDVRNIIIIITDGIESCEGDPCAVSLALQRKGIFLKPFIIGIGMDKKFEEAFGCMGAFYDVANVREFRDALNKALFQSLEKTTASVELLDEAGRPTETDVNVSFINSFTNTSAFEFVHYRDSRGRPDTVEIDPVLKYNIIVNTIPQVVQKDIEIKPGKHNVIPVKTPQGYLRIDLPGHTEYEDPVRVLLKDPETKSIYTHFQVAEEIKILAGTYEIEILSLPKKIITATIDPRAHEVIRLDQPGVVNFISTARGIGSLYEILGDGSQQWLYNLNQHQLRNIVTMQPGNYKAVFRSEQAKGSKFTKIRNFTVKSGSSLNIQL